MFTALHSCFPVKIHQNILINMIHSPEKQNRKNCQIFQCFWQMFFIDFFFFLQWRPNKSSYCCVLSKSQYSSTQEHIQITDMRACMVNRTVYLRHTALMRTTRSDFTRQQQWDDSSRSVKRGHWCRLLSAMTINVCASLNEQKTYRTTSIFHWERDVCVCVFARSQQIPPFST